MQKIGNFLQKFDCKMDPALNINTQLKWGRSRCDSIFGIHLKGGGGIYVDFTNSTLITHFISIVGYGVENKTKYWLIKNSFGT